VLVVEFCKLLHVNYNILSLISYDSLGKLIGGVILEFFEVSFVSFLFISSFTFISFILALTIKLEPQ
jgi:hypothetical protein